MTGLGELVGQERSLHGLAQAIYFEARRMAPPVVGALHVTCSDESEGECVEAFQQEFVQYLLPALKFSQRAPFRSANLGGRYEWGAIRLAESHFAAPLDRSAGKLIVAKINAHVAYEAEQAAGTVRSADQTFHFGAWKRYGRDSACCGALQAVASGTRAPFADDLREAFLSEGLDRVQALADPERVDPHFAPLFAAIVSARLQARKVALDIQDYTPDSPTYFAVLPCVTINRHDTDTEILCGVYTIDTRDGQQESSYSGLSDDPEEYEVQLANQALTISDSHVGQTRPIRDHRAMAFEVLRGRLAEHPLAIDDVRLSRLKKDVAQNQHRQHQHAKMLLRAALPVLATVAPVPAAVLAFADGTVGIHHAFRVHQLAKTMEGDADARRILEELHDKVDAMEGDKAEALVELLARDYLK